MEIFKDHYGMSISFLDCKRDLLDNSGPVGIREYQGWRTRAGYETVVEFVENFTHDRLFNLSVDEIRRVANITTHALGNVQTEEQLECVENYTTPFAFQHLFHWYVESESDLPTWRDFRDWMVEGAAANYWYSPLKKHLKANFNQYSDLQLSRAMRWRLANVYQSNMREIDLMARLREKGLPIQYHLLADVLLRVDFWINNILICVYFPNPRYRDGDQGRKPLASRFFEGAQSPFEIIRFGVERKGFGKLWLATDESITELIKVIDTKRCR